VNKQELSSEQTSYSNICCWKTEQDFLTRYHQTIQTLYHNFVAGTNGGSGLLRCEELATWANMSVQDGVLPMRLPMDIISTSTSSWIIRAASAAAMPEMKVASTGVPVAGQTCDRVLKDTVNGLRSCVQCPHSTAQDKPPRCTWRWARPVPWRIRCEASET
jgi:hypothetical protein